MSRKIKFLVAMFGYAFVAAGLWNFSTSLQQATSFFVAAGVFVVGVAIPLWLSSIEKAAGDTALHLGCITSLVYCFAGVGIVWGTIYVFEATGWTRGQWQQLPAAPEMLVALPLGATYEELYAVNKEFYGRTATGQHYAYSCEDNTCAWQAVTTIPEEAHHERYCPDGYPRTEAPPPKGEVVEERIKLVCRLGYRQTTYQLLENGSVWRWEKNNLYDFGIPYLFSLFLGGVSGILAWVFRNRPFWDALPGRESPV